MATIPATSIPKFPSTTTPKTNNPKEMAKCLYDIVQKVNNLSAAMTSNVTSTNSNVSTLSATVSQIITSGSNSNGSYIQFADGTIIEWAVQASITTSVVDGAVYINSVTVTFPIAFVGSLPIIITGSLQNFNLTWGGMAQGLTLATTNIYVVGPANSCSGYPFYIAVGKWK